MIVINAEKYFFRPAKFLKKSWILLTLTIVLIGDLYLNMNEIIKSARNLNQSISHDPMENFLTIASLPFLDLYTPDLTTIVTSDQNTPQPLSMTQLEETHPVSDNDIFSIPHGFEERVKFWTQIYSKYTSDDAVFHDSQDLSIIYKVVDLRPITQSSLHPFVKEHRVKRLIKNERQALITQLQSLKKNLNSKVLSEKNQTLFELLSTPKKKSQVTAAIENLRMQQGQKDFIEKALISSDSYLPLMEEIFIKKGLPKELTRIPFVESSFNLGARSRVGASGIWQIMPATGRKLMPNDLVDYRNDPIKATDFAATLLKFNLKVTDAWPLAITAYNHGPTSIKRISKKYKSKDLAEIIRRAYGSHAFGFASSNFYACFLAMLDVEKNRSLYFPETPRQTPLAFTTIQLKKPITYQKLLSWFNKDTEKTDQLNPHLASSIKKGSHKIPSGTVLYLPENILEYATQDFPRLAQRL